MSGKRVQVETSNNVRLDQLDAELGGHGLVAVEGSSVIEAELAAAIDVHTSEPLLPPPVERLAALESRMDCAAEGAC